MPPDSTIQTDTADAEEAANVAAGVLDVVDPAIGAAATAGLQTAETVANAVEAAAPHATAVAAIGAGVTALASTPIVQASPQAAAASGIASSFFAWLQSEFSKL